MEALSDELKEIDEYLQELYSEYTAAWTELEYNVGNKENNPYMSPNRPNAQRNFNRAVRDLENHLRHIQRIIVDVQEDRQRVLAELMRFAPIDTIDEERGQGLFNFFNKKATKMTARHPQGMSNTDFVLRQIGRHVLGTVPPNKKQPAGLNTGLVGIKNPSYSQYQQYYGSGIRCDCEGSICVMHY